MAEDKVIKGFKGFDKDFKCRGFQFEEGKTYKEDEAVICKKGFHFCTDPFDVLKYYNVCDSMFAAVEATGKTVTHGEDSKVATTEIKITAKLSLGSFIKASVDYLLKNTKPIDKKESASSGDSAKLASSGYSAKLASSGYSAKLASSGDYAQLASSGDYAQLASSGYAAKLASSGYAAKLASSGYAAQLASSGYAAQLASSGYSAKLASSGYSAKLASSGDSAQLASSGYSAKLASSGDSAKLASSGYAAKLASSGDSAKLEINGADSVGAGIGIANKIKGSLGSWITLAEWEYDNAKARYVPKCVQSAQIDGKKIKADTWYKLENKKFVEA